MRFFSKLFRNKPAPDDDYWYFPRTMPTSSGIHVSEKDALKYLTVFGCVTLISGDVGKLPLNLYKKRKDGGKDLITDTKLYDVLHNAPNPEMPSFLWRETAQGHLLLWGNHYSKIERDSAGNVVELWPIPDPGGVIIQRIGNELVYKYKVEGKDVVRRRDEIFHIPGFGFNGLKGQSMISLANEAIGMGLSAEQFGNRYFGEGTHPSGILTFPPGLTLGDKAEEYKKNLTKQYSGLGKSHAIMILENGEEYKSLNVPLEDAQFLQTRDHQKVEICGMYHVPPHKIAIHGQNSNYNNLEQENASYVDSCLMHWLVRWEQCISLQLLSPEQRMQGLFVEHAVQGLLRGDSVARGDFYNKMFQIGSITPNEIRSKENMNPIEGGDKPFVMLNMVPLDMAEEVAEPQESESEQDDYISDEDDRSSLEKFFRSKTDQRSIQIRDRITKRYHPLFLRAAEKIVNFEGKSINNKVGLETTRAAKGDMETWLEGFYKKLPDRIQREIGPVFMSFMDAIAEAAAGEIGIDELPDMKTEINDYISAYTERHIGSSKGQMMSLLNLEAELEALSTRADEWMEKRPNKIANNETVRSSNYIFQAVAFTSGFSTVWRIRGPKTCPYCTELNGKRVVSGESFVSDGDELDPTGGNGPMKIYGMKTHPPLHQGCDCYLSV
jgi:HK97 family phage portal protein